MMGNESFRPCATNSGDVLDTAARKKGAYDDIESPQTWYFVHRFVALASDLLSNTVIHRVLVQELRLSYHNRDL